MELAEIQHAIEELPREQQAFLAAWLVEREQAQWDAEMDADFSPGGPGTKFVESIKEDVRRGKFRPVEDRTARI